MAKTNTPTLDAIKQHATQMRVHGCTKDEIAEYVDREIEKVPREEFICRAAQEELEQFVAEAMVQLIPRGGGITVPVPEYLQYKCECSDAETFIRESVYYGDPMSKCQKCGTVAKLQTPLSDRQRDVLEFQRERLQVM